MIQILTFRGVPDRYFFLEIDHFFIEKFVYVYKEPICSVQCSSLATLVRGLERYAQCRKFFKFEFLYL